MDTKTCSKCGETKALELFERHRAQCKACVAERRACYYAENAVMARARQAGYQAKTADKKRKQAAVYRAANVSKTRERNLRFKGTSAYKKKIERESRRRNEFEPRYLAFLIGAPLSECPSELLELKRTATALHRAARKADTQLKGTPR